MKLIKSFHGEDLEASSAVDEGPRDRNAADGGRAEHGERTGADRGLGVIPEVEGSAMYVMERFHDYKLANNRSIVEHAHEIQCIAKELEFLKVVLPNIFVVGCIIAKLPSSWRNFTTSLKHKRQEISVENLIASLDVEEKARAKDTSDRGGEIQANTNMVQKNHHVKNNSKNKPQFNGPINTTYFKNNNKKKVVKKLGSSAMLVEHSATFPRSVARDSSILMGNGSHATIHGVATVDLKFTSGMIVQLRNVQHVPTMNQNLIRAPFFAEMGLK
ncbi:uncharacterized protein [Aegilops tauschii subsp. strangulata]|uniref:uncharacterized protein n=1 Tax=Aegilops tauschii subsp. strangulata TaxID=200361 RepID=UPI003CC894F0